MKKIICIALVLVMLVPAVAFATEEPNFSFTAVSDVHFDDLLLQTLEPNFVQYAKVLANGNKEYDDLFICGGDMSSYGNSLVWYGMRNMAHLAGYDHTVWALGNHEYGTLGIHFLAPLKFMFFVNEKAPFYVQNVDGYDFICLAVEEGIPGTLGSYSEYQLKWFEKQLNKLADQTDGKPIFVIAHYGPQGGNIGDEALAIMKKVADTKNEDIVYLWGHYHSNTDPDRPLANCDSDGKLIKEDVVTDALIQQFKVNKGSVTTARMGSTHYYLRKEADGLYVNVYPTYVEFKLDRVSGDNFEPDTVKAEFSAVKLVQ